MLDSLNLKHILFLDIETVPQYMDYEQLPHKAKYFWDKKSSFFRANDESAKEVYQRAGIYAEFGKVVCISVGIFTAGSEGFKLKSFAGSDEKAILKDFIDVLIKMEGKHPVILCAHNGKEFDYPYLSRRMLINGLKLPEVLNIAGKKPWEIKHLDTLDLWKFGDYKHYTSLDLLTHIFEIQSPKEDIDGSMVSKVFYAENDIQKIVKYCESDVLAVGQLLLRYMNKPLIKDEMVERSLFT